MDFVMIWVDGSDPDWQIEYAKYAQMEKGDSRPVRFRDTGTLQYWFRGVEKFAPWVDKIHFVTCGHYPKWLNLNHPKLNFVSHRDFIPEDYLPTFNSHVIEHNLFRINGLADEFVYFNDDTFIINEVKPTRFFKDGLPCDTAVLNAITPFGGIMHIMGNNVKFINEHYYKREVINKNKTKWFNLKYGKLLARTLFLNSYSYFVGFYDPHLPNAYLKSTFEKVWKENNKLLDLTCKCRFRSNDNVNQYIMRYTQLCEGWFHPINVTKDSLFMDIFTAKDIEKCCDIIKSQSCSILCANDNISGNFNEFKMKLEEAFDHILGEKSTFEL